MRQVSRSPFCIISDPGGPPPFYVSDPQGALVFPTKYWLSHFFQKFLFFLLLNCSKAFSALTDKNVVLGIQTNFFEPWKPRSFPAFQITPLDNTYKNIKRNSKTSKRGHTHVRLWFTDSSCDFLIEKCKINRTSKKIKKFLFVLK